MENQEIIPLIPNDNLIVVDLGNALKTKILYLSSLVKNVHILSLENNSSVLIGRINKLLIHKEQLFILDMTYAKGLFVFNRDGSFSHQIGSTGKGPGEYINISDFTIDPEGDVIYILDSHSQKINWYEISTGEYINSIRIKNDFIRSFRLQFAYGKIYTDAYLPPGFSNDSFLLRAINTTTGEQESCWMPASQYNKGWNELFFSGHHEFSLQLNNTIKFSQLFMDTVVSITQSDVTPYMVIRSENLLTANDLNKSLGKPADERYNLLMTIDKIHSIKNYFEFREYIYFEFRKRNSIYRVFYDKTDQTTHVINAIIDDLIFTQDMVNTILPRFYYADDNGLYGVLQSQDMSRFLEIASKGYLSVLMEEKQKQLNISEDSNPIIFYYEFKE